MAISDDAHLLAWVASELHGADDLDETARAVLVTAARVVPDAQDVSLSVRQGDHWQSFAATSDLATRIDELQRTLGEGPSAPAENAAWSRSGDLDSDARWPRWGPHAAALGVRSMLHVGLVTGGRQVGAIAMFSTVSDKFADTATNDRALLFGVQVTYALSSVARLSGLRTAMNSRHTIGMAQGMLRERFGLDTDQSFAVLRRLASQHERKLRDIAADIVEHGTIDGLDAPRAVDPTAVRRARPDLGPTTSHVQGDP